MRIGVAQTRNSTDLNRNFEAITEFLRKFEQSEVDLILFPECSLSGCSARMKACTQEVLKEFLQSIQQWCAETGVEVVLPTAFVKDGRLFNSGFWLGKNRNAQFFKIGLTESEQHLFSLPNEPTPKVFDFKGYRVAVLICREAQQEASTYFKSGEADVILWPAYYGWTREDDWTQVLSTGEHNTVFDNMKSWRIPLIQSNFAFNDLEGYSGPGPVGRSVVVDSGNRLAFRGACEQEKGFIVHLGRTDGEVIVHRVDDLN